MNRKDNVLFNISWLPDWCSRRRIKYKLKIELMIKIQCKLWKASRFRRNIGQRSRDKERIWMKPTPRQIFLSWYKIPNQTYQTQLPGWLKIDITKIDNDWESFDKIENHKVNDYLCDVLSLDDKVWHPCLECL